MGQVISGRSDVRQLLQQPIEKIASGVTDDQVVSITDFTGELLSSANPETYNNRCDLLKILYLLQGKSRSFECDNFSASRDGRKLLAECRLQLNSGFFIFLYLIFDTYNQHIRSINVCAATLPR